MLITTIFYESYPFTCRGGFTTWHMSCFVRDVCTIRQFSTAPFFLQYFLIDFGFHRLSMCCELFPRIGFQITAIRYIGAHPSDLFGSDGTPPIHRELSRSDSIWLTCPSVLLAASGWVKALWGRSFPSRKSTPSEELSASLADGHFRFIDIDQLHLFRMTFLHRYMVLVGFHIHLMNPSSLPPDWESSLIYE